MHWYYMQQHKYLIHIMKKQIRMHQISASVISKIISDYFDYEPWVLKNDTRSTSIFDLIRGTSDFLALFCKNFFFFLEHQRPIFY